MPGPPPRPAWPPNRPERPRLGGGALPPPSARHEATTRPLRSAAPTAKSARAANLIARAEQLKPTAAGPVGLDIAAADRCLRRGRAAEREGEHELALALYEEAARCPSRQADALFATGLLERALGRRQRASTTFKNALHAGPGPELTARLFVEIGQLYWAMGEDREAAYYYRRARALDPSLAGLLEAREARPPSDVHELNTRELNLARIR